ncbi:MAG TPA: carboxypeptidase-like regulatory domain-containing protein [Bryobacteraceae bacterium]|nr:carboxypeptidase-like regulatory domain-containing protein [Bryobacteraceae bacterium]
MTAGALLVCAQTTQTGIHGTITDPSGAVVPNATVKLTDTGTGIEKTTTAASDGGFVFPDLQAATYKVTVTATGFQTAVIASVVVDSGRVTDVPVRLAVGSATETVEVNSTAPLLETSSNEVGTTINNAAIQNLPYSSRDVLMFSLLMAGNTTANDATGRNSTFNGLPNASLNISIDGMNNNSQRFKSGGTSMYAFAPERIDAIEEVTVSTTGLGADAGAGGAMNIRFTTKRGTDTYHFSVGEQFANEDLNANTFFGNLHGQPISRSRQNNPYGSFSGPLLPFIPSMKHKLFFFAYVEAQPQPTSTTNTITVLNPDTQAGNFTYIGTDGATRTVNLLQVAGAAGYTSTIDPTISGILSTINGSQSKASGYLNISGQPYWRTMEWTQQQNTQYIFPSARVDYQITPKINWHGTWNLRHETIDGGPNYPGLAGQSYGGGYKITTYIATSAVDWQITPTMLNNTTFGVQSNGEYFYQGSSPQQWGVYGNRNIVFPGFTVNAPNQTVCNASATATISPVICNQTPFIRNNPVYQVRDDLNWVKGKHTILIGGAILHTSFYETSYGSAGVPSFNLGIASGDPVVTTLTSALPAINTGNGDLNNAEAIYAFLTGRLSSITGSVNVNEVTHQYNQFAPVTQRYAFTTGGLYVQDSFRVTPHFTLNYGFRWQFDGPIKNTNGIDAEPVNGSFFGPSTGLFAPGSLNGVQNPQLALVGAPYKSDLVNPAPNVGFAWTPTGGGGILGKFLGNGKTVIRGGASVTYYNEGMNAISNVLSSNQGTVQSESAQSGTPGFPLGGVNLSSPAPPLTVAPASFGYPINLSAYAFTGSQSLYLVNPNLVTPYTTNWNIGIQRELPSKAVLEVRYIGNKSTHMWHYQNLDEVNIFENGFLPQFVQAQQNLTINQANGKGNTFINNGLPGQAALPIFETAFGANGSNAALAASSGFSNTTFITDLQQGLAGTLAGSLASVTTPTYYCRLVGGNFAPCANLGYTAKTQYPINFFVPNPYGSSLRFQSDDGNVNYNGLQVEVRKAFSHGLTITANLVWSHGLGDLLNASDQTATYQWFTQRNARLSYGPTPFDRRIAYNSWWTYDLPIGKGREININNPILDRIVGGWTLGGVEQIATGSPSILNSTRDTFNNLVQSGVFIGNGLTLSQLQHDLSTIPNMNQVTSSGNLLSNVSTIAQSNGISNPAYYGPAATPGAFSQLAYIYGTTSFILNMSLNKSVRIHERLNIGFRLEALNFLNHPFFALGGTSVTANTFGQVSSASGNRTVLLRAFLSW